MEIQPNGEVPAAPRCNWATPHVEVEVEVPQQHQEHQEQQGPTPEPAEEPSAAPAWREDVTLEHIRKLQESFAEERDWSQYHTPRNLLLALVGEVGELSELFQWKSDGRGSRGSKSLKPAELSRVAEEMSDVLLYLVRMSDVCGIDLGQAALDKVRRNAAKYPAAQCHGSAAKYTKYTPKDEGGLSALVAVAGGEGPSSVLDGTPAGLPGPSPLGGSDMAPWGVEEEKVQGKRKRFTDDQVEILTQVAERAHWSLQEVPAEERDSLCKRLNVTRERLTNFFNNRKPKDLKRARRSEGPGVDGEAKNEVMLDIQHVIHAPPLSVLPAPHLPAAPALEVGNVTAAALVALTAAQQPPVGQ